MLATPSIVMLLEFGRCPFTVKPLTAVGACPPTPCCTMPGTSVVKVMNERSPLAMFFNASLSSVNERSPLVDCSSVTRLVTVTSSVIWPTSIVRIPADSLSFAPTTRLVRSCVLKPCRLTDSV